MEASYLRSQAFSREEIWQALQGTVGVTSKGARIDLILHMPGGVTSFLPSLLYSFGEKVVMMHPENAPQSALPVRMNFVGEVRTTEKFDES